MAHWTGQDWDLKQRAGHSALFSSIKCLSLDHKILHIGALGQVYFDKEGASEKLGLDKALSARNCLEIEMDSIISAGHYEGEA